MFILKLEIDEEVRKTLPTLYFQNNRDFIACKLTLIAKNWEAFIIVVSMEIFGCMREVFPNFTLADYENRQYEPQYNLGRF